MGGKKIILEPGTRFGRLTVLVNAGTKKGFRCWECLCQCGTTKIIRGDALIHGRTMSCGCLQKETAGALGKRAPSWSTTHGMTNTPEFRTLHGMIQRCHNPRTHDYKWYGAQGVSVYEEWRNSFEAFLRDMGPRPSAKHSIDRYPDPFGNYEPGNCRWATVTEQMLNRRKMIKRLTYNGKTMTIKEWADELNLGYSTIARRIALNLPMDIILSPHNYRGYKRYF